MKDIQERIEDLKRERFEKSLRVIFTPWQVGILKKRAEGVDLTPAERQELSRRIKPKVLAIEDLQDLGRLLPMHSRRRRRRSERMAPEMDR